MKIDKYKKDLLSTLVNQLWRIISGPLVLMFIPLYLNPIEQGYWYTFISVAALSIFADLGFSTIILQFAAHEFAHLQFNSNRLLIGDERHLWKLASFFRFSVRWLGRIICVAFPLIVVGGYLFLSSKQDSINWQGPWLMYSIASGIVFFNSSILCFFEGCNSVSLLQSIRFKIAVCTSLTMICGLYFHLELYALALSLLISALIGSLLLVKNFYVTVNQLWIISSKSTYDWWPEFSSLIWRYSISWCSGYFIFQLFTPLAFHFHGPEAAGKIGISISMWTAGFSIASSWITAITPKLNMLIAERKWTELDALFDKNLLRCMGTMCGGGFVFFGLYICFLDEVKFFQRLVPFISMLLLFFCWLAQTYINSLAVYLRAYKKEPLMQLSFYSAIYVALGTWLSAKYLRPEFLFVGFFSSYFFVMPIVIGITKKCKKRHSL